MTNKPISESDCALDYYQLGTYSRYMDPYYISQLEKLARDREGQKLIIRTVSSIMPVPTKWIYPEFLPLDEVSILVGEIQTGKTSLCCMLTAGVTRGKDFQLGQGLAATRDGHVIIVNMEDGEKNTLFFRLKAAGADLDRVHIIDCVNGFDSEGPFSFANPRHLDRLATFAENCGNNIGLLIIDPIYSVVDGDFGSNFKARVAYQGLARLAKRLSCAILGIAHAARNPFGREAIRRVAGPPALREVPRSILLLSEIKSGPTPNGGTHVLVHAKNSNGMMDGGFEYRNLVTYVEGKNGPIRTAKIELTGELFGSPEEILKEADRPKRDEAISKTDAAVRFLQEILKDGPQLWVEIERRAKAVDVKKGTLMLAKGILKIVTKKQMGDGRSIWCLPDTIP